MASPSTSPSTSTVFLPTPTPAALADSPRARPDSPTTDPIDDFFGVTRARAQQLASSTPSTLRGSHDSRHDLPPPYARFSYASLELPGYSAETPAQKEPVTLAMYLFKYGFMFPLFWLAGACILFSTLSAPPDWEVGKTASERAELLDLLRRTERKWATRCAIAATVFSLVIVALVVSIMAVMRWT